ncbi:MAG: hypothetical protein OEY86_02205 [Nitrospira sp.]|nr:hypothetical protein [Nitrospira sp.]
MAQITEPLGDGFDTPIAVLTFNRPELTERLLNILGQIKPRRMLVVSDGPRSHVATDVERVTAVRRLFEKLDWECHVDRNFAECNMGSFPRNSSGLSWVFDQVEEAVILEDDCVPEPSFFPFCEELLRKYRDDQRVGLISGNNFLKPSRQKLAASYFFSGYATTWGWASWRRTWRQVDLDMPYWLEFRDSGQLRRAVYSDNEDLYWRSVYDAIHERRTKNAWDYQLMLTCRRFNLLTIVPAVNLVSNVGFGGDAVHYKNNRFLEINVPTGSIPFPLVHPAKVEMSRKVDYQIYRRRFNEQLHFRAAKKIPGLFQLVKKWI